MAQAERDAEASGARHINARVAAECDYLGFFKGELPLTAAVAVLDRSIRVLREAGDVRGLGRAELYVATLHSSVCNFGEWGAAAGRAEQQYVEAAFSPAVCISIQAESLYYGATPVDEAFTRCAALLERSTDKYAEASVSMVLGALHAIRWHSDAAELIEHARRLIDDIGSTSGR